MNLSAHIFRAYDIRGLYGDDFDEDGFSVLGLAIRQYIGDGKILLTGDGRTHTNGLLRSIAAGLTHGGHAVAFGGLVPTPVTLLCMHEGDFRASVQITASHNGPTYNGVKISTKTGSVCGDELQTIFQMCEAISTPIPPIELSALEPYAAEQTYGFAIAAIAPELQNAKVIVDAGNGIPGAVYPGILSDLGLSVVPLFCDIDGTFPNHQPDPEDAKNLQFSINAVETYKADFALAYDGDGDRVGIVTSNGTILTADHILYVLSADYLSRNPGASIVLDIMCSAALAKQIKELGGEVIWSPTGHSHIERTMHSRSADLGGEQSGHFMFGEDFYGHDDALLATIRFLSAVQKTPALLEKVTTEWPKLLEYKEKRTVPESKKFAIVMQIQMLLAKQYPGAVLIDGARIDWEGSAWGIIRASNTSPKISIRIQASNQSDLDEYTNIFKNALDQAIASV